MDQSADGTLSAGTAERLKQFLRGLPRTSCMQILEALERAKLAGQGFPGADTIMGELVAVIGAPDRPAGRGVYPARFLFAGLEPFLIDERLPEKRPGRIERGSLIPIWSWLRQDLAPGELQTYEACVTHAMAANRPDEARALGAKLQQSLIPTVRRELARSTGEQAMRRLVGQLGGPQVHADLLDMLLVFENREVLRGIGDRVGGPIKSVDEGVAARLARMMTPLNASAETRGHAAILVLGRLSQPWQLLKVALVGADTDNAVKIADSPYAAVVETLMVEAERLLVRSETARVAGEGGRLAPLARDFATYARTLATELDLSGGGAWAKRIGSLRAGMAEVLRPEIDALTGRVRRLLAIPSSRPPGRQAVPEGVDDTEVQAILSAVDVLVVARSCAAELALNEATLRVFSELEAFLDAGINPLLEGLRTGAQADRPYRLAQLDAAVKIAGRVLGTGYAALLAKAVEVAAGAERRGAKVA